MPPLGKLFALLTSKIEPSFYWVKAINIAAIFKSNDYSFSLTWLGSLSLCSSFFISPVVVAWCRRKSTRLTAVLGGLVAALGCLFTSFASQFHQALFSYGLVLAVGLGMARDAAQLVLAQYFKRRRHCVEVAASAGAGLGVAALACILHALLGSLGWRHGLQAATGLASLAFLLGVFYRSASLYHPQRRAIVHLKNQKRKIKEKHPTTEKPPFFDFAALRTRTLRVVMTSAALAAAGVYTPFFYLVPLSTDEGVEGAWVLQALLGLAFAAGSGLAGLLQLQKPSQCLVGRRCLCQLSLLAAGLSLLSLQALQGFAGYVLFASAYGISAGSLAYALKMLVFERLRARHFNRAWGFVQWVQCLPVLVGVPVTGYISKCRDDPKAGFYFSAACTLAGATTLFLLPASRAEPFFCGHPHCLYHHNNHQRPHPAFCGDQQCPLFHRHQADGLKGSYEADPVVMPNADLRKNQPCVCTCRRSLAHYQRTMSWATSVDVLDQPAGAETGGSALDVDYDDEIADFVQRPELLTCISEEGLADMVDPSGEDNVCNCAPRDRAVVSPRTVQATRCTHEPLLFRSAMTPIEEVTSTV
ncbi:monocarboxylate transporter 8-like [Ixodes scapularis]|uniref:monocarboxylate transporter 8-like n=1 Tax=Ixodes scapularis TaxID=6945 RepID=UPI001C380867|nr:monocarboxylate transporter 8-like [Ixodes scapularis]